MKNSESRVSLKRFIATKVVIEQKLPSTNDFVQGSILGPLLKIVYTSSLLPPLGHLLTVDVQSYTCSALLSAPLPIGQTLAPRRPESQRAVYGYQAR